MKRLVSSQQLGIYAGLNAFIIIIIIYISSQFISIGNLHIHEEHILMQTQALANQYAMATTVQYTYPQKKSYVAKIFRGIKSKVYITNLYGFILYSSDTTLQTEKKIPHPIVSDALLGKNSIAFDTIPGFTDKRQFISAAPIVQNNKTIGSLVLITSTDSLKKNNLIYTLSLILSIFTILAIGYFYFTSINKKTSACVNYLAEASKQISSGDFSTQINTNLHGSIGELARNMKLMSTSLENLEQKRLDYITNVSHDFRTPLTTIKGFVEAMLDGTIQCDNHEKYLLIIRDETNRLTTLTKELLALSTLNSEIKQLNVTIFDIHEVIKKIIIQFEQSIRSKNINVHLSITDQPLLVQGDLNQIYRVIFNLVSNAIHFSENENSLFIKTSTQSTLAIITIQDTGKGIDPTDIPHIFERFYKGDKSRNAKQSSGIGLAIVKEILDAHHQTITVESELGKGTKFAFTLSLPN